MTLPAWVPHDEQAGPEPLLLVQSFVNTRIDQGTDLLAETGTATRWLHQSGLLGPGDTAGAAELRGAREFRESIRALLAHHARGSAPAAGDLGPLEAVVEAPLRGRKV